MIISLIIAVCVVYVPYINNALFFDDFFFFSYTINYFKDPIFYLNLRWFPYATIGWTWKFFLDTPLPLHAGNIALHCANTLLIFSLLRKLLILTINENYSIGNALYTDSLLSNKVKYAAWLGALLFACHPVAVYATGYVVQRSILMATFFALAMQLTFLHGLISQQKLHQYLWMATSVLFYFLAVFSKEHSLMMPAVLIPMAILFRPYIRTNKGTLATVYFSFSVIAIFVILKIRGVFGVAYEHDAVNLFEQQAIVSSPAYLHLLSVFTQAGLFFKYLLLWALPNPAWMSIDMRETFADSANIWEWLKVTLFILYGILALKLLSYKNKTGLIGFALLYPWILFMTEFSAVRVQEPFVLYRSYIWAPGLILLMAIFIESISNKRKIIFLAIILSLIPLSWNRLWVFADNYRIWNDAALLLNNDTTPGAARIFYNRGNAELTNKKIDEAIIDFKKVISLYPKLAQAHTSLGYAYLNKSQFEKGLESFDQATLINPTDGQAYLGKAFAYNRLHNKSAFLEALNKSCQLKNTTACLSIAVIKKNN